MTWDGFQMPLEVFPCKWLSKLSANQTNPSVLTTRDDMKTFCASSVTQKCSFEGSTPNFEKESSFDRGKWDANFFSFCKFYFWARNVSKRQRTKKLLGKQQLFSKMSKRETVCASWLILAANVAPSGLRFLAPGCKMGVLLYCLSTGVAAPFVSCRWKGENAVTMDAIC